MTRRRLLNCSLALDLAVDLDPVAARTRLGARPHIPTLSPASFALAVSPTFKLPPHLDLLDRTIVETIARGGRLLVTMPPRHGKSELCSRSAPAWFLGKYPERRVMLCSFDAELAAGFGRRSRDLLRAYGEQLFGVAVRADSAAADRWDIVGHNRGGMLTAGIGGSIAGRGANLLIVDDPVKSVEDAESETVREKTWDWFRGTAMPRLEPGAAVIVIMTRWHEDDLGGRILENNRGEWRVLSFSALAEDEDSLGRQPGEALWPDRFPVAVLEQTKHAMGSRLFSAEYQQRPVPVEGALFKRDWLRRWRPVSNEGYEIGGRVVLGSECQHLVTCDLAVSTKSSADYTVIACWAVTPANELILVDLIRRRMEGPDIVPALSRVNAQFKPYAVGIESTGFQTTIVQEARNANLPVIALKADKDKVSRAHAGAARIESGRVFLPAEADWLDGFEAELLNFPECRYDDQVDALSYAVAEIARRSMDWSTTYSFSEPGTTPEEFDPARFLKELRMIGASVTDGDQIGNAPSIFAACNLRSARSQ